MTNTSQQKTRKHLPPPGYRFGIAGLLVLLALSSLLYYGYCWGWWGRNSLLLQYLLQCRCPPASEQRRYPASVKVIIPACSPKGLVGVLPSGRTLYMYNRKTHQSSFLDLDNMTEREAPNLRISSFITDELWLREEGLEGELLDIKAGRTYPIHPFTYYLRPNSTVDGQANIEMLISELRSAEKVFYVLESDELVVLMPDPFDHPDENFTFDTADLPDHTYRTLQELLEQNHIPYTLVPNLFPMQAKSPDGRLLARWDGIFVVETREQILEAPVIGVVRGWMYDGSGVIYSKSGGPCLLNPYIPMVYDAPGCWISVPQPVIKLKVPRVPDQ